jgi:hypothetical protein
MTIRGDSFPVPENISPPIIEILDALEEGKAMGKTERTNDALDAKKLDE